MRLTLDWRLFERMQEAGVDSKLREGEDATALTPVHPPVHPPTYPPHPPYLLLMQTPTSIWERIKAGATGDISGVMKVWTKNELWYPPRQDQVRRPPCAAWHGNQLASELV